jgi:hypothetical protein
LFREACAEVQSSISEADQEFFTKYPDANSMLQAITQQVKEHPVHQSRLTKCSEKIRKLSEKLSPFFQVVDIFVQANSECAALVWGSIRLIFQVSCYLE